MPFGRAPVLEVDGTRIAGSMNILRHLGAMSSSGMELKVMGRINWYKNSKRRLFHKSLKRYRRM